MPNTDWSNTSNTTTGWSQGLLSDQTAGAYDTTGAYDTAGTYDDYTAASLEGTPFNAVDTDWSIPATSSTDWTT